MRRLAAAAAAALALPAAAASLQAAIDNDVVFGTDRGYTSGVRLSWFSDVKPGGPAREFGLSQDIFTPDTKHDILGAFDRPYAGRLALFGALHRVDYDRFDTLALAAGVTGPSALGRQSQDLIHRVVPSPETDWSRQLSDRLDASVAASLTRVAWRPSDAVSIAVHGGGELGTVRGFAHAGAEIRYGAVDGPYSALLRHAPTPVPGVGREGGLSAFLGASVQGVFRDRLLDREAGDPGIALDRKRAVARIAAGVSWRARWGAVTFTLARDTDAFAQQRYPESFGSLVVALPLD